MLASRIMIVEDEGIIAMDIRRQLEGFGYEVVATAFSGGQAITLANEYKPDLVMMDIVLKGDMDGISAAHAITESLRIPVIFLTAYSDPATLLRAKATGAYGYLIKPFRPDELHASIEVALYKYQLERRLKESEQWFGKTLHCISDAVIATDAEGVIRFMNPVAETITEQSLEQAKGKLVSELMTLISESSRSVIENPVLGTLQSRTVTGIDCPTLFVSQSGLEIPVDDGAAPILDDDGTLLGAVMVFRDITARRQMEHLLRESEERFHSSFELAAIGMALIALDGSFLQVNNALCEILGYTRDELLGSNLRMLTHADHHDKVINHYLRQLVTDVLPTFQIEAECFHKVVGKTVWTMMSASLVRTTDGEPQYFIVQIQNISNRKYAEQQLIYLANHDPLTGLLNRDQFHNRLTQALSSGQRHNRKLAVMYLDLDRFKLINDTLGHRLGDLLLQAVSDRLRTSVRSNDILARLGGDEFIVLLSDINQIDDVARIAQKTLDTLTQPFTLEGNDLVVTASIGISIHPDDGKDSHTLLMNADTAMYLAKERGKNNFQFYTLEMTEKSIERMKVERGLRHALAHDELRLHYQPQICTGSGVVVSAEALVRWQHPEWGLVYPDRFINVAEETGLIVPIGAWVLREACLQAKTWIENDGPFGSVAVNVSARQFLDTNLFQTVKRTLAETGLNPSVLELEITESAIMQDPENTLQVLHQFQGLGVRLSIDDFGTGYSSLTYLRRFPIQSVKIDRSFVIDLPCDEGSKTLVRAITALAHELKLSVVVEGVETRDQLSFLTEQKCDSLQGYMFSRPVSAEQFQQDFINSGFKTYLPNTSNDQP
ncbi:EAL domain-containing protein [Methylomonas methanica]|uniref:cyclic-guanylate-specific phosphodiesterase n=1 Tax=Methylomonas methanica (strain DSM 25384 / MC09) TaxID=857087 RepID=F9ZVX4_METMM|nr:EAL domain-containing protein [Methylomonas methanica]AEG00778.1 response regulator receiver modulated diguanylate cyclase/phosphodiesterase with PAS/PAC sensor(s) [Methylomonas methanica MC09]